MPRFSYDAYQADGRAVSGTIDARDELQALEFISSRGLTPADIRTGSQKGPWWTRELSFSGASSVKPRDLEGFFESFATLLAAQLPLPRALAFCEQQAHNIELKQSLSELRSDIENGKTLSAALEAQNTTIPERLQSLLRLGESSNTLPQAVTRAAALLHLEADLRRELNAAMVYPMILLVMSVLVLALIVFYLAPTLSPVFTTAGTTPPVMLQFMNQARDQIVSNPMTSLTVFVLICFFLFAGRQYLATLLGKLFNRIPVIANYRRARETLRFCQTLGLMLTAGATLPKALRTAEDSTPSRQWKAAIAQSRYDVEAGGALTASLEEFTEFDPLTLSLLRAGEESDTVVAMLNSAADKLQNTTQNALQQALRLLTPTLTLLIGGMVGFLIISTISAILDLNDIAF
ncbi:type II secretion system F family protein [Litoreibacter sp.]|nr:type II secretion system F family protein [Litoreibacter sp.]